MGVTPIIKRKIQWKMITYKSNPSESRDSVEMIGRSSKIYALRTICVIIPLIICNLQ